MSQTAHQDNFKDLIDLSECLLYSTNDLDTDELQFKVMEYTRKMENHFLDLKSRKPTEQNMDELKQLMHVHEMVKVIFQKERDKVTKKLKNLHVGKEMQNTYPDI